MPGRTLDQLPIPPDRFRVDLQLASFETLEAAVAEDSLRSCRLRDLAKLRPGKLSGKLAARLAAVLDPANNSVTSHTLASSRYMRNLRIRFTGAVLKLVNEDRTGTVIRADVIKPVWAVDLRGLRNLDLKKLKEAFRGDLFRAARKLLGPDKGPEGFLLAVLHGEFETAEGVYQPHYHLVATGDWAAIVNSLRVQPGYRRSGRVKRPVRIKRELTNLPYALSYLLKSYWPAKWAGHVSGVNAARRSRGHQRIPEPYHSELLLWLNKWKIGDIILKIGVKQGKEGLYVT